MNTGQFQKGHTPYNKGMKRGSVSPETEFQKGVHAVTFKGYGVPSVCKRTTKRWEVGVTIPEQIVARPRGRECLTRRRIPYARYLWIENYGAIPHGMIVYNNEQDDPLDIRIENLELIDRSELLKRNRANSKKLKEGY